MHFPVLAWKLSITLPTRLFMSEINHIKAQSLQGDCRIAIVMSRYNSFIGDRLLKGCLDTLKENGVDENNITLLHVPGAFEIPVAVKGIIDAGGYDAIITLGAVIRGETPHFDYICTECARGIMEINVATGVPVIFGVLTVDNTQQALDRSGDEESNKGSEAAITALEMISVLRQIS